MSIIQIHCDDPAHDDERESWWPTQVSETHIEYPAERSGDVSDLLHEASNSESDGPGGDAAASRSATALAVKVRKAYMPNSNISGAESDRLDDLTAYCSTLLNNLHGDDLDDALYGEIKRRGQGDKEFRQRALDNTHPDDLAAALARRGITLAKFGIAEVRREHTPNARKIPPGIIEEGPPDTESSVWVSDLGGRGTGRASWSWLKKRFGTPDVDYFKGHRLYIQVRPFDANSQWIDELEQQFTPDAQREAEKYGFDLMRDEPRVAGFWVSAYLDMYWHDRRGRFDKPMLDLGRYVRAQHTPNADWMEKAALRRAREAGAPTRSKFSVLSKKEIRPDTWELEIDGGTDGFYTVRVYPSARGPDVVCNTRELTPQQKKKVLSALKLGGGHTPNAKRRLTKKEHAVIFGAVGNSFVAPPGLPRKMYRGLEIEPLDDVRYQELGYAKKGRQYLIHLGDAGSGGTKLVSTMRAAQEYIDEYLGPEHTPNASSYYVWVVGHDGTPLATEGPYGPHPLEPAKQLARIGATEGAHDRVVSLGLTPSSPSFEIVRRYRKGTGERII